MILATFDLQATLILPMVSSQLTFGLRTDYSTWLLGHPDTSYQVSSQLALLFRKSHWGHLGVLIGTILAIFDLQVSLILPAKFQVIWPFGSGEAKNRFSKWPPCRPSWISVRLIRIVKAIFDLQVILMLPTKFQVNWPFGS